MRSRFSSIALTVTAISLALSLPGAEALAETGATAGGLADGTNAADMWGPALRMLGSLIAVLAIVGALAWVAQRLKNGGHLQSGLIQVVSGVSLGNRDKVVLLRVNDEEILVGVGPSGMRSLHVMQARPSTPKFSDVMDATE
ncbi:MAG: flagellar biosynthetic protein FliO [Gammaproteobacteria bacterium]